MGDGTILLADDVPRNTELFSRALKASGFAEEVVVAGDGVEVLDYLFGRGEYAGRDTEVMPRLIVLDVNMPRMDGLETLRRLRADDRTRLLPVVMFSSSSFPDEVVQAYRLGGNSYVDKASPAFSFPELVRQIARYWLLVNEAPPRESGRL